MAYSNTTMISAKESFHKKIPFNIIKAYYLEKDHLSSGQSFHTHEFIEISLVSEGYGFHILGNKKYKVSKGDLFIINFDTPHVFTPVDRKNSGNLTIINCIFLPQFIGRLSEGLKIFKKVANMLLYKSIYLDELEYTPDLKLSGEMYDNISHIYERMYKEITGINQVVPDDTTIDILKLLLCDLLINIYRLYENKIVNFSAGDKYKYDLIRDAIAFLHKNYNKNIRLSSVFKIACLSNSQFCSIFKKVT